MLEDIYINIRRERERDVRRERCKNSEKHVRRERFKKREI